MRAMYENIIHRKYATIIFIVFDVEEKFQLESSLN